MIINKKIGEILALFHDPLFIEFELAQDSPSIFNAVGRTHTETWHSALIAWLLDSEGSHQLKLFPLQRFILLLINQDSLPLLERRIDLSEVLAKGIFSQVRVRPNERELSEVTVGENRFDIFIDKINIDFDEEFQETHFVIETKVKDKIKIIQCQKYIEYIENQRSKRIFTFPIFIAPTEKLLGSSEKLFGNKTWIAFDYQTLYDEVIEPCLKHPEISEFGKFTLSEYVKTLKFKRKGGMSLAITQKERELVLSLMDKHEPAIRALYEILSQESDDFDAAVVSSTNKQPIKIVADGEEIQGKSVPKFYSNVLKFLYEKRILDGLELPFSTSDKRYLISKEPIHPRGNEFVNSVEYKGYYMETNKNRIGAVKDLKKLFELCGIEFQEIE